MFPAADCTDNAIWKVALAVLVYTICNTCVNSAFDSVCHKLASSPGHTSRFSACNIEKLGVAWGRGYHKLDLSVLPFTVFCKVSANCCTTYYRARFYASNYHYIVIIIIIILTSHFQPFFQFLNVRFKWWALPRPQASYSYSYSQCSPYIKVQLVKTRLKQWGWSCRQAFSYGMPADISCL